MTTPDTPRDPGRFWAAVDAMIKADAKAAKAHEARQRAERELVESEREAEKATAQILEAVGNVPVSAVVKHGPSGTPYLVQVEGPKGGREREIRIEPIGEVALP